MILLRTVRMIFHIVLPYIIIFLSLQPLLNTSKKHGTPIEHRTGIILFSFFMITVFNITGIPDITNIYYNPTINLKLFKYINKNFLEYFLNILLFVPFGFFIGSLWKKSGNLATVLVYSILFSLFIECFQLFDNRVTDINDIITNSTGAIIGYFISKKCKDIFPNTTYEMCVSETGNTIFLKTEFLIFVCICWISYFALIPLIKMFI